MTPVTKLLPEHFEMARRLPEEERLYWWMRLGKMLCRKPERIPNARYLAYARSVTR